MRIGPERPHPPHEKFTRSLRCTPEQPRALCPPQSSRACIESTRLRTYRNTGWAQNQTDCSVRPYYRVPPSLYGWHPGCVVTPASVVPQLNTLFLMFINPRNRAQQDRGSRTYEKWAIQILSRTRWAPDPEEPHHAETAWTHHLPLIQSVAAWTKTRVSSRNSRDVLFPHRRGGHAERHPDLRLVCWWVNDGWWWFLLVCYSLLRDMQTWPEESSAF